jgi:TetR/AcrR family transcriptional regulator, copper-responsive repressor
MRERYPLYARSSNVDTQFMRELVASLCVEIHELAQMPLEIVEKPLVSWIFNPLRLRGVRTSYLARRRNPQANRKIKHFQRSGWLRQNRLVWRQANVPSGRFDCRPSGFLVSSDFKRSTTCCLRLGGMGPPRTSSSSEIVDHLVLYLQSSSELADNVAMGRRKLFTREDVLDKAIPIFWKHGLAETSAQDLEQATGVRKSGLYAEFEDKEDLFVQSMRMYLDVLMARGHLTKQPLGWINVESFLKVCYGSWGQKGCFSVNSMREFADLPPKARQVMVASVIKVHQLLIDNLAAARGVRDDNDSLAGLVITFFSGICLEQNLGPDRARITKKIEDFMQLIRGG